MKTLNVKLDCGITGDRFAYSPGEVVTFRSEEAQRLVKAKQGQIVETAAIGAVGVEVSALRTTTPATKARTA